MSFFLFWLTTYACSFRNVCTHVRIFVWTFNYNSIVLFWAFWRKDTFFAVARNSELLVFASLSTGFNPILGQLLEVERDHPKGFLPHFFRFFPPVADVEEGPLIQAGLLSLPNQTRLSQDLRMGQDYYNTLKLSCAKQSFNEMSAVVEFNKSSFIFCTFWPIWLVLAWADRPVCTSPSGLQEERKKYSIGKLGYASVRAECGTQRQLNWHGAGQVKGNDTLKLFPKICINKLVK